MSFPNPTKTTWRTGVAHQRGSANNAAKLTDTDVRSIINSTAAVSSLALMFGVSQTAILRIKRGETWKHIERKDANPERVDYGALVD